MWLECSGRRESASPGRLSVGARFEAPFRPQRSPFLSLTADRQVSRLGGFGQLAGRAWLKPCVERSPLASRSMELPCVDLPKVAQVGTRESAAGLQVCRPGAVGQTGVGWGASGVRMMA